MKEKKLSVKADADDTKVVVEEPQAKVGADDTKVVVEKAPVLDPFDPERLRVSQDFAIGLGIKKLLTTVPVRKPSKEWWIMTHPDEKYRIQTTVLELKEDKELYLIEPSLREALMMESTFGHRLLVTTVNRQNVLFLWPIRLPNSDGKLDDWNRSALEAAGRAQGKWIRVASNMSLGAYEILEAQASMTPPEWPTLPFNDLLRAAFKDKHITDLNHPVLRKLRGEV